MTNDVRFFDKGIEKSYDELEKSNPDLFKLISKTIEKLKVKRVVGKKIPNTRISKKS